MIKYIKLCLLSSLLLFGYGIDAKVKSQKKLRDTSQKTWVISTGILTKLHGNLDEQLLNDGVGENIQVSKLRLEARRKFKLPRKLRMNTATSVSIESLNSKSGYENINIINQKKIKLEIRQRSISQGFNFAKKINKKVYLMALSEFKLARGYTVEQEFLTNRINYHAIANDYTKYSLGLGGKMKFNRTHSIQGMYRFSEHDHIGKYTYDPKQGSNDRRTQTLGILHRIKLNKGSSIAVSLQFDRTIYRNRLSLDQRGYFFTTGLVKPLAIQDQMLKVITTFRKKLNLSFSTSRRIDEVGGGNGYLRRDIGFVYKGGKNKFTYSVGHDLEQLAYTSQLATIGTDKRIDTSRISRVEVGHQFSKLLVSVKASNISRQSNNLYGEVSYNTLSLGLNATF